MSDPATNPDIEDILSSIRRLISDNGDTIDRIEPVSDKLVLTPAFRVHEDNSDDDQTSIAAAEVAVAGDRLVMLEKSLDQLVATQDDQVQVEARDDAALDAEDNQQAPSEPAPLTLTEAVLDAVPTEVVEEDADEGSGEPPQQNDVAAADHGIADHDNMQDVVLRELKKHAAANSVEPKEVAEVAPETDDAQQPEVAEAPFSEMVPDFDVPMFRHNAGSERNEEKVAELEAAVSETRENWEPDGGEETAQVEVLQFHAARLRKTKSREKTVASVEELPIRDEKLAETEETPAADSSADDIPVNLEPDEALSRLHETLNLTNPVSEPAKELEETPDAINTGVEEDDLEPVDILDEAALQAMVADMIRAELQGEIGEKITRSVRKLVRREIERALTLKGL